MNLSTRLDGGTYELVCGNLSAPRGSLAVSGGAAATRPPSAVVDAAQLASIVASLQDLREAEADDLVTVIDTFTKAIDAGDLEAAKAAYGPSRVPWERIEPIAELFSDLDPKIDAREDDYDGGADDPAFTGYHRIEKGLYTDGTTEGLQELTATLRADVADLKTRLATLEIDPRVMARGAGELIDEVAQSKMTGEEDRYSKLDLWSINPNLEGSAKIVDLLRPVIEKVDAAYLKSLDDAYAVGRHDHREVRRPGEGVPDLRQDQRDRSQGPPGRTGEPLGAARRAPGPPRVGGVVPSTAYEPAAPLSS